MPALPPPASPAELIRLGLDESTADEAAQEIAELVEGVFGPFGPVDDEIWRTAEARELGPVDLSRLLADAAEAPDPMAFVRDFPVAQAMLERRMAWRWSTRHAKALGRPTHLKGQTWTSLSEAAREEVRRELRELSAFERSQIRRGPPKDADVDTFLLALAEIVARHTGYSFHEIGLSSHQEGGFIGLAQIVLSRLPPSLSGRPRVNLKLGTASALSTRWRRLKKHARTGSSE